MLAKIKKSFLNRILEERYYSYFKEFCNDDGKFKSKSRPMEYSDFVDEHGKEIEEGCLSVYANFIICLVLIPLFITALVSVILDNKILMMSSIFAEILLATALMRLRYL